MRRKLKKTGNETENEIIKVKENKTRKREGKEESEK